MTSPDSEKSATEAAAVAEFLDRCRELQVQAANLVLGSRVSRPEAREALKELRIVLLKTRQLLLEGEQARGVKTKTDLKPVKPR